MKIGDRYHKRNRIKTVTRASLTVEAALVLPIFLFFFLTFLYFIQIFTVQEHIQEVITKNGLSTAKTAYIYDDFLTTEDASSFDGTLLGEEFDIRIEDLTRAVFSSTFMKYVTKKDLDTALINNSCILDGFDSGISFYDTEILDIDDCIDIIVSYRIRLPIPFFALDDMRMVQRVRLRGWTGHQVSAKYSVVEEEDKTDDTIVYITETGSVYHRRRDCSHLNLSIKVINAIPTYQRNSNGGKYYPCESCCQGKSEAASSYYITSFGDRYHTSKGCSKLKRSIREIPLSEAVGRSPCKRCGQ